MEKLVGLSRAIKPEWLTKTVELIQETTDIKEIKEKLNEHLAFEIQSPTNLRKTREILLTIWYKPSQTSPAIWSEAIAAYQVCEANRLPLNWAMILLSYPVFYDICCLIGKISLMQDTFTTAWLKNKLLSIWGERTTLYHSSDKILQTLKNLGVIENTKLGVYKICPQQVKDISTVKVLVLILIKLNKSAYYNISELSNASAYFPFQYNASIEMLNNSPEFCIGNFGGITVVSVK
jgi:hypothetical protein